MDLNESYISRLQKLAGLITENRIQKLIAQKYPENIIEFATWFAKATVRGENPNMEEVNVNHYIPWIAEQAKLNPAIMKDKSRLSTVIHWIRNTGFNKIKTTIPFDEVFKKAAEWLSLRNKNLETGENISGGKVIKQFPDGTAWLKVKDLQWCMNAGAANGWCLDQASNARKFVGQDGNRVGFVLNDKHNNPEVAVQYNKDTGVIEDIQGRFNTPVDESDFPKVLLLFKSFPKITDIHGHLSSFWKAYEKVNDNLKHEFSSLPNLQLSYERRHEHKMPIDQKVIDALPIKEKIKHGFKLSQGEIDSLTVNEKLKYRIPLSSEELKQVQPEAKLVNGYPITPEEAATLPVHFKLHYKYRLTEPEIAILSWDDKIIHGYLKNSEIPLVPIQTKFEHDVLLTAKDIKKLNQPLREKVRKIANGMDTFENLFILERTQLGPKNSQLPLKKEFANFDRYIVDEIGIHLKMDEEVYDKDYSGIDEYNQAYISYTYGDSNMIDDSDEELKYMHNYLNDDNLNKIKEMARVIGVIHNYDFEEEGEVARFIENNLSNADDVTDAYIMGLDSAYTDAVKKSMNDALKQQIFKYDQGYLDLPWEPFWKFLKDKPITTTLDDLKDMEINGDINLEDAYHNYSSDIDDQDITDLNEEVGKKLDDAEFTMAEHPEYIPNVQKFNQIMNDLKFETGTFTIYAPTHQGSARYKKELSNRDIYIDKVDFANQKAFVFIVDFKSKKKRPQDISKRQKGYIAFDSIVNYIQQYELFKESEIRKAIHKILLEDYRYEYDRATYVPPVEVVNAAQRALQAVEANKLVQSTGSNEGSGLQKAKDLAAKKPVTHGQLKRMKAFFDNNASLMARERAAGRTVNNSPTVQSWELWGGEAGRNWAETEIRKTQSSNETSKEVRNSDMIARDNKLMSTTNTRTHK